MPAPFAALQDRVNSALDRHLTNALAEVEGVGDPIPVEFDEPYVPSFDGQTDAQAPECWGPLVALSGLERGDSLRIDGRPFEVLRAKPDGTGRVHLILRST